MLSQSGLMVYRDQFLVIGEDHRDSSDIRSWIF